MLKSIFSCLKPRQRAWPDESNCIATLSTCERASKRHGGPNTVAQPREVLTSSEPSFQHATAGKLVLALRSVSGETATLQHEVVVAFFNESAAKILGVPSLKANIVSNNLVVLDAFEEAEPVLFQDVSAHLLRVAAGDPASTLTLHLAASKYGQPHGATNTGSSATAATTTSSACQATSSSSRANSRVWRYATVEPFMLASPDSCRGVDRTYNAAGVRPAVIVTFITAHPEATVGGSEGRPESVRRSHMNQYIEEPSVSSVTVAGSPAEAYGAERDAAARMAGSRRGVHLASASFCKGVTSRSTVAGSDSASQHAASGGEWLPITKPLPAPEPSCNAQTPSMYTVEALPTPGGAEDVAPPDHGQLRLREGMVLSGMSPIVTAFSTDGGAVLYQNTKSTLYFGDRMPALASTQRVNALGSVNRSQAVGLKETAGSVLAELFCFEAAKLERMLAEVATEGHMWKGIVQVPSSCHPTLLPSERWGTKGDDGACSGQPAAPRSPNTEEGPGPAMPGGAAFLPCKPAKRILAASTSVAASGASAAQRQVVVEMPQVNIGSNRGMVPPDPNCCDSLRSINQNGASSNTNTTDMAVNREGSANGRLSTTATMDIDPLATSTWGLLLDTSDQPEPPEPYTGTIRASSMHSLLAACVDAAPGTDASNTSQAFPLQLPLRHQREPVVQSLQQAEAPASCASISCMAQNLVQYGNAFQSVKACAPRVPASVDLRAVQQTKQLYRSSYLCPARHSSRSVINLSAYRANSRHDDGDMEPKLVTRAASMSVHTGCQQNYPWSFQSRSPSGRTDLGFGWPVLRVIAFASSLKNTPTSVQAVLQQALASSAGGGVPCGSGADAGKVSNAADGDKGLQTLADWALSSRESRRWEQMPPPTDSACAASCQYPARDGGSAADETANKPSAGSCNLKDAGKAKSAPNNALNAVEPAQSPPTPQAAVRRSRSAHDQPKATLPSTPRPQLTSSSAPNPKPGPCSGIIRQSTMTAGGNAHGCDGSYGGTGGGGGACHTSRQQRCHPAAPDLAYAWHEVSATHTIDPVTGQHAIILVQVDVTAKVEAERHLAFITEAEHRLLEQVFPRHVLAYMTEEIGQRAMLSKGDACGNKEPILCDINALATSHAEVTLLFADIQGFTPMCKVLEPRVVMAFLNDLFTRFDRRLDEFGVYKVETIGDSYFVAGGLVHEDKDGMLAVREGAGHEDGLHAEQVFMFAKAILEAASQVTLPTTGGPVHMRIGIHSGPVVSGMVGQRMPRFCLFGDTVNTASRMESTGVPGCIHASAAAYELLRHEAWVPTGGIEVKGKGPMNTYLWAPPDQESQALLAEHVRQSACNGKGAIAAGVNTNAAVSAVATDVTEDRGAGQTATELTSAGSNRLSGSRGRVTLYSAGGLLQVWPCRSARPAADAARNGPNTGEHAACSVADLF